MISTSDIKAGNVTHYYDHIGVAVVDLTAGLTLGENIRVSGSAEFSQKVDSMQVEHQQVTSAKKGDTIGLKVAQAVKPGDEIVKIG
ncbi:MAG: Translation elongation factor-like protein [Candidatus Amesbacteria bacterium GW2011_GWB1_47_19]|nr:MAG: Translation elongation factor-like protein [Candidatus Amesbacteria bacterium GW2011_GWA1_44_24]KKU31168.1 MAG: Translation elongation factor-like protein [Candidatus Amesbacteria bacterium GW2011_GWC1_46_24]KKU67289.1 MAG: Translation elongation factor-like protein [Candidatus Amesbacteria bacterium GW2011_GWB1_47_19]HBC72711.1 hypothetical protein [Candidatus Amesbacteria bacterium]